MSTKIVIVPKKETKIDGEIPEQKITKRLFIVLIGQIISMTAVKNTTDVVIAHGIQEKLDAYGGSDRLEMESSEIEFITQSMKHLMEKERLLGSGWYFLHQPLRDAEDKKKFDRKTK